MAEGTDESELMRHKLHTVVWRLGSKFCLKVSWLNSLHHAVLMFSSNKVSMRGNFSMERNLHCKSHISANLETDDIELTPQT